MFSTARCRVVNSFNVAIVVCCALGNIGCEGSESGNPENSDVTVRQSALVLTDLEFPWSELPVTITNVNSVVSPAGLVRSTSKYGSSSVAAGATPMSQLSSLFVVAGEPVRNVASAVIPRANAEPDTAKMAIRAQTKVFLIFNLLHSDMNLNLNMKTCSPDPDDTDHLHYLIFFDFETTRSET